MRPETAEMVEKLEAVLTARENYQAASFGTHSTSREMYFDQQCAAEDAFEHAFDRAVAESINQTEAFDRQCE